MMNMSDNLETIEIDIPDDVFIELARMAHEQNITLNQLCVNILQAYVDGKVEIPKEDPLVTELRKSVVDIVNNGITIETLREYAHRYNEWFENAPGDSPPLSDIIQSGFDEAERNPNAGRT
jgi:hypothetical protein